MAANSGFGRSTLKRKWFETKLETYCTVCGVEWVEELWGPDPGDVCAHCDRSTCQTCGAPAKPTPLLALCRPDSLCSVSA